MAFYLDDEHDDQLFIGRPSGVSFLSLSQGSTTGGFPLSQQSNFSATQLSQEQSVFDKGTSAATAARSSQNDDDDAPAVDFVCSNCGSRDAYLDETTNDIICNVCFTQSQTHVDSSQQQFDYDDAVNMASRGRDGRIQTTQQSSTKSRQAKGPIGSRAKPLSEYDNTKRQPPLSLCLQGFQTVLQESCKIVCRDLMVLPSIQPSPTNEGEQEHSQKFSRKHVTKQVLKTVRDLWQAYLWSWHEGAEFYAALYPQVRFAFRDCFLQTHVKGMLYQTLAAKAAKDLKKKIQLEQVDVDSDDASEMDIDGEDPTDDVNDNETRSTNTEKVPMNLVVPSRKQSSRKRKLHIGGTRNRKMRDCEVDSEEELGYNDSDAILPSRASDQSNEYRRNDMDDADDDNGDDMDTVVSDLSKGTPKKGDSQVKSNTLAKLMYFHASKRAKQARKHDYAKMQVEDVKQKRKLQHLLGRKEAALILQPSLVMVMGMILIATAPYGVSESDLIRWLQQGALPLLNAFDFLLNPTQKETLHPIATFFRSHTLPTFSALKRMILNIHVACGYKPLPIHLKKRKSKNRQIQLNDKALLAPGRTILPSNVPLVLATLVAELGLSQKVLNFALALMGYPVARQSLVAYESPSAEDQNDLMTLNGKLFSNIGENVWLPPILLKARPDRLNDLSRILAVVVVACKLIPDWHDGLEYKIKSLAEKTGVSVEGNGRSIHGLIPWNREHFRLIANGKMEKDYLSFLEATVLYSSKYVLSEFAKSLDDCDVTDPQKARTDEPVHSETVQLKDTNRPFLDSVASQTTDEKKKRTLRTTRHQKAKHKTKQTVYTMTSRDDTFGANTLSPPLGPLVEYLAYKTGISAEKVVDYVMQLDEEVGKCGYDVARSIVVSPQEAFDLIFPSDNGKKASKEA